MNHYLICEICKKIKGKDFNRHKNDYFCWEEQRYCTDYYNSKHSTIKERVEDKIKLLVESGENPDKYQLLKNEIGNQLIYDHLFNIQSKQTCYGWKIQKDYLYRTQLFYDEYDQGDYFGDLRGHYFSISDITAYPFMLKVITINDIDENLTIKTPINSDIYCFVQYIENSGESKILGWISAFDLKNQFISNTKSKKSTINSINLSRDQLCPNFHYLLEAYPDEYEWQCKRSRAHRVLELALHNTRVDSHPIAEPGYYRMVRTDHWGKDDFFKSVKKIHHTLFQKGFNDDDIIQQKIPLLDLLEILKESLNFKIMLCTTKKNFENTHFTDYFAKSWNEQNISIE